MILFIIVFLATGMGAISGIGGGIIIKPMMDLISDLPAGTISFLSGCAVLAMSLVSLVTSHSSDVKIEKKTSTILALGAALGGVAGKELFQAIQRTLENDRLVSIVQNGLLLLLVCGVFVYMLCKSRIHTLNATNIALCGGIGLLLGMMGSFLGIGGGPINLVVLYYFFSMDTKTAALNSLYIILFSQAASLLSVLAQARVPPFDIKVMAEMVAGGVLGGLIGRRISRRISATRVEGVFYVLLVVIAGISVANLMSG